MVANSSDGRVTSAETSLANSSGTSTIIKSSHFYDNLCSENPVVESSKFVLQRTDLVSLDREGIKNAARYITRKLAEEAYNPTTWRTHELHLCPPARGARGDPRTKETLDWIFLISSLNFSFWSELDGMPAGRARFGVEWRAGWNCEERRVWTGYWSLVAAIDRALEEGIPITDPAFYSNEERCPDSTIASVFAPAPHCQEGVPLLNERIRIMRENGSILCRDFGGSFQGFVDAFEERHAGPGRGSALQFVKMVTETFPSFRDSANFDGQTVYFWKRAQILVAEFWAAFYPLALDFDGDPTPLPAPEAQEPHPFLPGGVGELTMFADYRVPQILHHLRILSYSPQLMALLESRAPIAHGAPEELAIRAGSILGVEAVRTEMIRIARERGEGGNVEVSSVLIDFYLWDLAKRIEEGSEKIEGVATQPILPAHRTRSIWY